MSVPRLTLDGRRWVLPPKPDTKRPQVPTVFPAVIADSDPEPEPQPEIRESFFVFSDDPIILQREERKSECQSLRKRRWFPALNDDIPMGGLTNEELAVRAWAREWIMRKQSQSTMVDYTGPPFDLRTVTMSLIVELWRRQSGLCALSGRQMVIPQLRNVGTGKLSPRSHARVASVDRINSSIGYEAGNIQLACYMANCMKSNMPADEFASWCVDVVSTMTPERFTGIE